MAWAYVVSAVLGHLQARKDWLRAARINALPQSKRKAAMADWFAETKNRRLLCSAL